MLYLKHYNSVEPCTRRTFTEFVIAFTQDHSCPHYRQSINQSNNPWPDFSSFCSLHKIAADLATEATSIFLSDVRSTVGDDIFAKFLNLKSENSLALVIDVSGSMSGEGLVILACLSLMTLVLMTIVIHKQMRSRYLPHSVLHEAWLVSWEGERVDP